MTIWGFPIPWQDQKQCLFCPKDRGKKCLKRGFLDYYVTPYKALKWTCKLFKGDNYFLYPYFIIPRFILTLSGCTCKGHIMGQIDLIRILKII